MKNLRAARLARSSISKCAKHFGVTPTTWLRWERMESDPGWEIFVRAAQFLGVSLDQLAGLEPIPGETKGK